MTGGFEYDRQPFRKERAVCLLIPRNPLPLRRFGFFGEYMRAAARQPHRESPQKPKVFAAKPALRPWAQGGRAAAVYRRRKTGAAAEAAAILQSFRKHKNTLSLKGEGILLYFVNYHDVPFLLTTTTFSEVTSLTAKLLSIVFSKAIDTPSASLAVPSALTDFTPSSVFK